MNASRSKSFTSIAVVTLGAFVTQLTACGELEPAETMPSEREASIEVQAPVADESGAVTLRSVGQSTVKLDQYPWMNRTIVVDGKSTTDVTAIRTATDITVPLNNGGKLSLHREGDLYQVTSLEETQSLETQLKLRAFRLLANGYELFRTDNPENSAPNSVVTVSGIDDLAATRDALTATMAMQSVLATVEEGETIAPAVAVALIAAVVVVAWMAACGGLTWYCANHCERYRGFDVKCGGLKVKLRGRSVDIGLSLAYSCACIN